MPNPRKPTALKVLHGTNRKDRANPAEPKAGMLRADAPPPDWLSERGREAWTDLLPLLRGMKVATVADPTALALLCDALAEYVEARSVVAEQGAIYWTRGKVEMQRTHPAVAIAQDAWRRAKTMLSEFGLTPAARSRVSSASGEEQDPLAKWAAQ